MKVVEAMTLANDQGCPIVVEGPSDEVALRELGLTGEIVRLNLGGSVLAAIEDLAARHKENTRAESETQVQNKIEVLTDSSFTSTDSSTTAPTVSSNDAQTNSVLKGFILLTDWDRKGGQLARRLREAGKACGLKADSEYRRRLAFFTGSQIRCVEDLPGFLKRGLGQTLH